MRRLGVVILTSLVLVVAFLQRSNIPVVEAPSPIYQGDLIISGNTNHTIIDQQFVINGSIRVEDNATLYLKNATIKFVQTDLYDHRMDFGIFMVGGTPRLQATNSTITSDYDVPVCFIGSSSLTALDLNMPNASLSVGDTATGTLSNCVIELIYISNNYRNVVVHNSKIELLQADCSSNVLISNSTLAVINIDTENANFSLIELKPRFFDFWSFRSNCSVTLSEYGRAANVTLMNTQIDSFEFFGYNSNITAVTSIIGCLLVSEPWKQGPHATADVTNCSISTLHASDSSCVWLTNSTYNECFLQHSAKIYVYWYLDVHVIDSISQNVPSANVTASYPNATLAESKLTDANGWARLMLMEKMMNATEEYPVGNYTVEATYDIYSDAATVNMTENEQIALTLEDFVIPEFPSFLILPLFMIATLLVVIVYRRKHSM